MVHQVVVLGVTLVRRSRDDPKAKSPRIRKMRAKMVKDPKVRAELVKVAIEGKQVVEAPVEALGEAQQVGTLGEALGGLGADHGQADIHLQPMTRSARSNPSYLMSMP
jgi:hypothetical protein